MKTGTLLTVKVTLVPVKYHLHSSPKGKTSIPTKQIFHKGPIGVKVHVLRVLRTKILMESGYALNVHNRYLLTKLEHKLIKK